MSFVIKATVYMTSAEYDSVEVKRGDIQYIVDYGDRLRTFLGDIPVETLTFADFTQDQIDEIKSAAQQAAEDAAAVATQAASSAESSEQAAKDYSESAEVYANKSTQAEGYDESARQAAAAALDSARVANEALLRTIAERVLSQSYAVGGTGSRDGEDTDNAKYYMQRAQAAAEGVDEDYQYLEDLKRHMDETAEQVDEDMRTTEGYKDTTLGYMNTAGEYKDAASLSAQNAHDSEVNAKASEDAAKVSETNAHNSEVAAKGSEDAAAISEQNAKASENAAAASESNAHTSEVNAKASENAAAASEANAHTSEVNAKASENAAAASETNAHTSEVNAKASENAAAASEANAHTSEVNAKASENAAAASEANAHTSEVNAKASEDAAKLSENNAKASEDAATLSEQHASASEANAHDSEVDAAASAAAALASQVAAAGSASAALTSEQHAKASEDAAKISENNAKASEDAAALSEQHASASEANAHDSEVAAAASAASAESDATLSESWAVGGTGTRTGEDTNNAAYWAEQARQLSPDGKADKVIGATEGDLAGLDATGNLTDSGLAINDVARQDGYYAKEGLGAKTAENLIDPNATPNAASFGFRTAAGEVSISDDSNGQFDSFEGVTHTINQAVKPSDSKTATGEGSIQVADGYAGSAEGLVLTGDTYVRNQLVQDHVTKDADSASGVINVSDAIASDAPGFTMRGDAYIRNQWVQNGDFSDGTNNWDPVAGTISVSNNVCTFTYNGIGTPSASRIQQILSVISGHAYLCRYAVKSSVDTSVRISLNNSAYFGDTTDIQASTKTVITAKFTPSDNATLLYLYHNRKETLVSGDTVEYENVQLVDLTQLCNGDTTRINAITSWDDLVARYPEYANYVPYNTGEIVGSQPTYKKTDADSYAYGIIMDTTVDTVPCQRVEYHNGVIEQVQAFSSMPAHDWHRCVMDDLSTCHVNYYLDPADSTKKYNGTYNSVTSDGSASVLTGADGDVMVEMQPTWWRLTENYAGTGKHLYLVSNKYFQGAVPHRFFYTSPNGDTLSTQYVGAYRAILCDADGIALNTTEGALSQNNGTASTRKARSVAGALPWTSVTLADLRAAAVRNGGTHVNFDFHMYVYLMMMIEYATVDTQAISAGYSNGKNYVYWCFRKSGRTNYGNGTGQTLAAAGTNDDDNFYSLKVNNVQLYRDVDYDANGYYGWSTHTASPTRYWTASATPGNGATAYSDTAGTASSYTTTSWSTTSDAGKVIQFQYRGIENPFGEVWEFEDGFQKYADIAILSVKNSSNVVFNRDSSQDATGAYAWKSEDGTTTIWTAVEKSVSATQAAFSDSSKTISAGFTVAPNTWRTLKSGYWQTNATSDYTSTDQQAASTKTYWWFDHEWPTVANYIRSIDPKSLLPTATGDGASSAKWFRDRLYNDTATGSRVSYLGGFASGGANGGLGIRILYNGLSYSGVVIGGRASARKPAGA